MSSLIFDTATSMVFSLFPYSPQYPPSSPSLSCLTDSPTPTRLLSCPSAFSVYPLHLPPLKIVISIVFARLFPCLCQILVLLLPQSQLLLFNTNPFSNIMLQFVEFFFHFLLACLYVQHHFKQHANHLIKSATSRFLQL
jgi:hypothetical protein